MQISNTEDLGRIIRQNRLRQGMTQTQLAGACGTGVRFIVDLEKGKSTCALGKALHVFHMLGLSLKVIE